jgi:hypothetical protein
MTDYCNVIAVLLAESRNLPRVTENTDPSERRHIDRLRADIHRQQRDLRRQAAKEFAALNGWRFSKQIFSIKTLTRGGTHAAQGEYPGEVYPLDLLDHAVYFREMPRPYRPVAIVGQPYDHVSVEKGTELARALQLDLYAPPNSVASWWYPGHTRFFCLTRPGVAVRFLPDQLTFEPCSRRDSDAKEERPGAAR